MTSLTRNRVLVIVLLIIAFLRDLLVTPDQFVTIVFAIPVLVAAYALSPRDTLAVGVAGFLMAIAVAVKQAEGHPATLVRLFALAVVVFLSRSVSAHAKAIQDRDVVAQNTFAGILLVQDRIVALARGESRELAEVTGPPEMQELAEAFNRMVQEIASREEALRHSEQQYRLLFETMSKGVVYQDVEGKIISMNPAAERILGRSPEDFLGQSSVSVEHDTIREDGTPFPGLEHPAMVALQTGREINDVVMGVFNPREQEYRWIDVSAVPLFRGGEEKPYQVYTHFADITEHKRAEEEMRKARDELELRVRERTEALSKATEEIQVVNQALIVANTLAQEQAAVAQRRASELEATIGSIADGVFICDRAGRVVEVNEAGMRLVGLTKSDEPLGLLADYLDLMQVRSPAGRPVAREERAVSRALQGEIVVGYEEIVNNPRTGHETNLLVSAAPMRDVEGRITGAVSVMSDITPIRELDKLKDEFILVAAHELKTPVAIMKGYSQALLRAAEGFTPPTRKMLYAIGRGSDRIDRIVDDLLDISRLRFGQFELTMERVNLPETVEEVIDRMAITAIKHRIQLVRTEPLTVEGDRRRLEQVLQNLLDNAIKYTPQGGDIEVAIATSDHEAVVSVKDRGVGIPGDKQQHIFECFYRAHTRTPYDFSGMGVGLFISKEIIAGHRGKMWFESEEGVGSTFCFSVPF